MFTVIIIWRRQMKMRRKHIIDFMLVESLMELEEKWKEGESGVAMKGEDSV